MRLALWEPRGVLSARGDALYPRRSALCARRDASSLGETPPRSERRSLYSFATACSFHHLTEQAFTTVYVVCRRTQPTRRVRDTRYVFVGMPAHRFFGFESVGVLGSKVQMATVERAVLDAASRQRYAGGIGELSRIVRNAALQVSWPRLLDYAQRWRESAVVQRLGYLLDANAAPVDEKTRAQLHDLVRADNKIFLGDRKRWRASGKLIAEWGIIENVPRDVLIDRGDLPRRPSAARAHIPQTASEKFPSELEAREAASQAAIRPAPLAKSCRSR
jgi:hypothetical protein